MSRNRKYSSYSKSHCRYLISKETQDDLDRIQYCEDNVQDNFQEVIHSSSNDDLMQAATSFQSNGIF